VILPLIVSVPHAGLRVPPKVAEYCILSEADIVADGDEGAAEIYGPLRAHVAEFVTTDVARAVVDLNRAEDDFRKDGVIKTHTCWEVPVYREAPPAEIVAELLERYHRPYHKRLTDAAGEGKAVLGVDCHTMAAVGPPVGPDSGKGRPAVCLGDVGGTSLPHDWSESLAACFKAAFAPHRVSVNEPFSGGYITQTHAREMPWVQVELSRSPVLTNSEKGERVLAALQAWCASVQ
jgi:N-formylglutamate deformylase